MKIQSQTKPNKAKIANNQSSLISNHLEGKSSSNPIQIYPRMSQSGAQFQNPGFGFVL